MLFLNIFPFHNLPSSFPPKLLNFSLVLPATFTHLTAISLTLHVDQAKILHSHSPAANICQFGLESNDFYYCSGSIENFPIWSHFVMFVVQR